MKWYQIADSCDGETHAMEVHTGVIVREIQWSECTAFTPSVSLVFVPGVAIVAPQFKVARLVPK